MEAIVTAMKKSGRLATRWSPLQDAVVTAGGSGGHRWWKRWSPLVEAVVTAGGNCGQVVVNPGSSKGKHFKNNVNENES